MMWRNGYHGNPCQVGDEQNRFVCLTHDADTARAIARMPELLRASQMLGAVMSRGINLLMAAEALGVMPEGYCFCSRDRIGDDSKTHEPECRDMRAAMDDFRGKTSAVQK
jgi:hypothetical protein